MLVGQAFKKAPTKVHKPLSFFASNLCCPLGSFLALNFLFYGGFSIFPEVVSFLADWFAPVAERSAVTL